MNKIKLSATSIIKNEEKVIGRCLDSIKNVVDEFIYVDTGSQDNTIKIIESKIGKCYHTQWEGNYAKARNYGIEKCTGDWILVLDADEYLKPESAKILKEILENIPNNVWEILVRVIDYNDETMIPIHIVYAHRLFRNHKGIKWEGKGHESLSTPLEHRIQDSRIIVMHDKTTNAISPLASSNDLAQVFVNNFLATIEENPKNSRAMFYLANTYMGQKNYKEAIKWYHIYLNTSNWKDERYQARLYCARCYVYSNNFKNAKEMLLDAYEERNDRNEGDILLGEIAFVENKFNQALIWFNLAKEKAKKAQNGYYPETLLFLEGKAYTYLPYDWLAITYYKLKDIKNAIKYTLEALNFLPNDKRLLDNLKFLERSK